MMKYRVKEHISTCDIRKFIDFHNLQNSYKQDNQETRDASRKRNTPSESRVERIERFSRNEGTNVIEKNVARRVEMQMQETVGVTMG